MTVKITNPKGQSKELANVEYYSLLVDFGKTKQIKVWASRNHENVLFAWKNEPRINMDVIEKFLKENGYKIEKRRFGVQDKLV